MRRLMLAVFLFMSGSGMLLTGALTSVASAAPALACTAPAAVAGVKVSAGVETFSAVPGSAFSKVRFVPGGTDIMLGSSAVLLTLTGVNGTGTATLTFNITSPSGCVGMETVSVSEAAGVVTAAVPGFTVIMASPSPSATGTAMPTATATRPAVVAPSMTPTYMTPTATATRPAYVAPPVYAAPGATVYPAGPVGTGGGGSLGGGVNAALAAVGALFILVAMGLGAFTWRRSRGAHLS